MLMNEEYSLAGRNPELLTIKEVATAYRVHEMTVRRHIATGRLRAVRVGRGMRVRRDEMESYLEAQEVSRSDDELAGALLLASDDALFGLVGAVASEAAAGLSGNKYAALGEAYETGR